MEDESWPRPEVEGMRCGCDAAEKVGTGRGGADGKINVRSVKSTARVVYGGTERRERQHIRSSSCKEGSQWRTSRAARKEMEGGGGGGGGEGEMEDGMTMEKRWCACADTY